MNESKLKSRFCPSPTGLIHVGNVRTALFNFLIATAKQGVFLLRIEDTDRTRSEEQYTQELMDDLQWLGLQWNEGPGCEKDAGPYWQSQRQAVYDVYYEKLQQMDLAYPCFCTESQLALARKVQRASGKPPRYSGVCRNLSAEEVAAKLAQGLQPTLRFRIPHDQETVFHDLVRGEQRFKNNDIGDFIIRRADGTPPFMYCNAIDDALMGVTHALRGEDHLTNTPRQVMILQALQLPIPSYGHISLIMGSDGAPLSKRTGSRSIKELREQGFLPKAIVNYLARLGHYYAEESLMNLEQLSAKFSIDTLGTAPARFDFSQLLYWQRESILHMDTDELWNWIKDSLADSIPAAQKETFVQIVRPNITFPIDAAHWAQVFYTDKLEYGEVQAKIIKEAGETFFLTALQALHEKGVDFAAVTSILKDKLGAKGKMLFQPLRVALTNELHGPELAQVFDLLGKERIQSRLQMAAQL